jgi:catechol 2,3-dioxygenase-like lactoylglutathione lyase family enzyme
MHEDTPFKRVGAVILLVSEMERSVKFYRDVLNLPIKSQSDDWTESTRSAYIYSASIIVIHIRSP